MEGMVRVISPPLSQLDSLPTPLTEGERQVLRLFDNALPESWEIYVQPFLNGLRPDFVLLNPAVGIAVFEVKDWSIGAYEMRGGGLVSICSRGEQIRELKTLFRSCGATRKRSSNCIARASMIRQEESVFRR